MGRSRPRWTVLVDSARPGWENMAVDCALLDLAAEAGAAFLRLYRWAPHCLSFGRHEPATRRYDRERIRALGLDCVRRPTGGRAVWHARELTYAVAAPLALFGGLRSAYGAIHAMIAEGLRALGVEATLATGTGRPLSPGAGPCFAAPVGGEVMVAGRKVVGSAQLALDGAFLQHGSLLLEDDQALVRDLAGLPQAGAAEATLAGLLGRTVRFEEVAEALVRSAGQLGETAGMQALPATLAGRIETHVPRFRGAEWTWAR